MAKKEEAIILDFDGTISNAEHRTHYVRMPKDWNSPVNGKWKKNWKAFNDSMVNDTPNKWCVDLIRRYYHSDDGEGTVPYPKVIIITGRSEADRAVSEKWLKDYDIPYDELYMRDSKDNRPAFNSKVETYNKHIKDKYDVLFVIDDRAKDIIAWRDAGITAFQCAEGNF